MLDRTKWVFWMVPTGVNHLTLVLFIILFKFFVRVLTCMGIGYSIWVMYKLTDRSQPHPVDREFTLLTLRWVQSSL